MKDDHRVPICHDELTCSKLEGNAPSLSGKNILGSHKNP